MYRIIGGKEKQIIIFLIIANVVQMFFLLRPFDSRVSNNNLRNFVNTLYDEREDNKGVLLISTDQKIFKVLDKKLELRMKCDKNSQAIDVIYKKKDIPPEECLENGDITPDLENQRVITITPVISKRYGKYGAIIHDTDPRWIPTCGQGNTNCH